MSRGLLYLLFLRDLFSILRSGVNPNIVGKLVIIAFQVVCKEFPDHMGCGVFTPARQTGCPPWRAHCKRGRELPQSPRIFRQARCDAICLRGVLDRDKMPTSISRRPRCKGHTVLLTKCAGIMGCASRTFNFQYPVSGARWTFCSFSSRLSALTITTVRFRNCSARSPSLTTTSPVGNCLWTVRA